MVGRPLGMPPWVTSSKPAIPVRDFSSRGGIGEAPPFSPLRTVLKPLRVLREILGIFFVMRARLTGHLNHKSRRATMKAEWKACFTCKFERQVYRKNCMDGFRKPVGQEATFRILGSAMGFWGNWQV